MMNMASPLTYVCAISLVGIFLIPNISKSIAFGEQSLSPNCGNEAGFNIASPDKRYPPNTNVAWKLVDADGKVSLSGYFQTDSKGKINDLITIDDVKKGHYKLYFGSDKNNDGDFDSESGTVYSHVTIPCPK